MTWHTFWRLILFSSISKIISFLSITCWSIGIWFFPLLTVLMTIFLFLFLSIFLTSIMFYEKYYFISSLSMLLFFGILSCIIFQRKYFKTSCDLYSIVVSTCKTISSSVWILLFFTYTCIYISW